MGGASLLRQSGSSDSINELDGAAAAGAPASSATTDMHVEHSTIVTDATAPGSPALRQSANVNNNNSSNTASIKKSESHEFLSSLGRSTKGHGQHHGGGASLHSSSNSLQLPGDAASGVGALSPFNFMKHKKSSMALSGDALVRTLYI